MDCTTESATASRKHVHELIAVIAANHVSESSRRARSAVCIKSGEQNKPGSEARQTAE